MIRKPQTIAFWQGRLPHWEVEGGRYFVTIHLAGAIPREGCRRILDIHQQVEKLASPGQDEWLRLQRRIFREMEAWLDRAAYVPHFQDARLAEMVLEALEHRQQRGDWNLFEYVVMPNHVHLFFELVRGRLKHTLEDFKRWTGHQACKLAGIKGERFWQREWFDHWSRSDEEDERIIEYIRRNPVAAKLVRAPSEWPYGSWTARSNKTPKGDADGPTAPGSTPGHRG
jgi:type I restriction enzyme R subunit/putative DNA methylase